MIRYIYIGVKKIKTFQLLLPQIQTDISRLLLISINNILSYMHSHYQSLLYLDL